jgi:hypothetical protein
MKVTFNVSFVSQRNEGVLGCARLEADLPFAPTKELEFEHPIFNGPRKPASVSWNLADQSFYVGFGVDELPSKEQYEDHAQSYRDSGWTLH